MARGIGEADPERGLPIVGNTVALDGWSANASDSLSLSEDMERRSALMCCGGEETAEGRGTSLAFPFCFLWAWISFSAAKNPNGSDVDEELPGE